MKSSNLDKLNQIKQKYGYKSQRLTQIQPQPHKTTQRQSYTQNLSFTERSDPIHIQIEQKIQASRKNMYSCQRQVDNKPKFNSNLLNVEAQQSPYQSLNISARVDKKKPADLSSLIDGVSTSHVLKEIGPSQSNKYHSNKQKKENEPIIESYQKTYDLLKNYRKKIRVHFQEEQNKNAKPLNINSSKKLGQNKQNSKPLRQFLRDSNDPKISEFIYEEDSKLSKQVNVSNLSKIRCSPLQGLNYKKQDIASELSHLEELQNKIQNMLRLPDRK